MNKVTEWGIRYKRRERKLVYSKIRVAAPKGAPFKRKANLVGLCAGEIAEPVDHPKRMQNSGAGSFSDNWMAICTFTRVVREMLVC